MFWKTEENLKEGLHKASLLLPSTLGYPYKNVKESQREKERKRMREEEKRRGEREGKARQGKASFH